jgi:hypothetical protein
MADEQEQNDQQNRPDNPNNRLREGELHADPPKPVANDGEHDDVNDQLN